MKIETVADSFATYQAQVLPLNAPLVQILECQRAYFAGAYFLLMSLATSMDESTPDEEGIAALETLKAECEAFAAAGGMAQPAPVTPPDVNYTIPDPHEIKPILQRLGDDIRERLPLGWGFNLLLFEFGEGGGLFYIANAERADVINVMKEYIQRQTQ